MSVQLQPACHHHQATATPRYNYRPRISHAKVALPPHYRAQSPTLSPAMSSGLFPQRSFPTELLLIIFNFVFDDLASYCVDSQEAHRECAVCNSPYAWSGQKQKHVVWEWQDDVTSYALFPYSLAGVCRRWRDIMATVPQFWARLVIFVDTPLPSARSSLLQPPSPSYPDASEIQSHLSWSAKLPIEVYILRRRHSTSLGLDTSERTRTRMIFEALKPHLHRCHVLRFSVLQSTSLPSIVADFEGVRAPVLTDLRLECEIDDQRDWDWENGLPLLGVDIPGTMATTKIPTPIPTTTTILSTHDNHTPENPLQRPLTTSIGQPRFWCPVLNAISLNGRNFRDLSFAMRCIRSLPRTRLQSQPQRTSGASGTSPTSASASASTSVIGGANTTVFDIGNVNAVMTLQHVEKMTVAHYSASASTVAQRDGQEREFRVEDLLEVVRRERMPRLEFLKLVDLDMSIGVGGSVEEGEQQGQEQVIELTPTHVVLEELTPEVVCALSSTSLPSSTPVTSNSLVSSGVANAGTRVRYVNEVESFQIIRSSLPLPSSTSEGCDIPDTCDLVLEEIEDLGGRQSPIAGWRGNRLVCTGCNGFNDDFLAMLRSSPCSPSLSSAPTPSSHTSSSFFASSPTPPLTPTTFNAPSLQSLHLISCINYSIASLKTLILIRNEGLKSQFGRVRASVEDGPPYILEVVVEGLGPRGSKGPSEEEGEEELGEEDRRWFEERLAVFRWDVRGDGKGRKGRERRERRRSD